MDWLKAWFLSKFDEKYLRKRIKEGCDPSEEDDWKYREWHRLRFQRDRMLPLAETLIEKVNEYIYENDPPYYKVSDKITNATYWPCLHPSIYGLETQPTEKERRRLERLLFNIIRH